MKNFKDAIVDDINDVLEVLKGKTKFIESQVENQAQSIERCDVVIEDATLELESANSKLKKILIKNRKPQKVCMDICLMLVLLGLIGIMTQLV